VGKGSSKITTWRYQLFISSSREAEADAYQGVQDELNDLGQQGWELTAVTDAGDAKVFILKQPNEMIVDPSAA
jgi:FMN phosphatase YigB (HAD superfamily)